MLKQRLSISQRQRLSPMQIQVIRMLGYSTVEMEEIINKELEANPALEESDGDTVSDVSLDASSDTDGSEFGYDDGSAMADDIDIMEADSYYNDDNGAYSIKNNFDGQRDTMQSPVFSAEESFAENLFGQIDETSADEKTKQLARYLVSSLDENGYLTRSLANIADDLMFSMNVEVSEEQLAEALDIVRQLEPAGIGARNLQDCLLIQIGRKHSTPSTELATIILKKYFDQFTEKKYNYIKDKLSVTQNELEDAIAEITKLNPKPGSELNASKASDAASQIVPDFTVEQYNDNLYVSLNGFNYPKLSVSRAYREMLQELAASNHKDSRTQKAIDFTRQKIDQADTFIESIRQRNNTLIRTMIAIANKQRAFFLSGDDTQLVPMRLKDIAEISGYDASTISRVTNGKYVQTSYGVFPLRYLFSETIHTDSGQGVSSKKVMSVIRETVDGEDKHNPLTDDQIKERLNAEGYRIARRTVAKYREQMNIPAANKRTQKD